MHNLHLVVLNAKSPKAACEFVDGYIQDFGDENNWRTICGCVSDKDKVYIYPDPMPGRYPPDKESDTIAKINAMVENWIIPQVTEGDLIDQLLKGEKCFGDIRTWNDWWQVKDYAEHMSDAIDYLGKKFNILAGDSFRSDQYADIGVTQIEQEEGKSKYVVFVDMHS